MESFTSATKSVNDQKNVQKEEKKEEFEFFFGAKFVFSQFHPAKFKVDEITYNCMEQYMHHQKAVTFNDKKREQEIMMEMDPKKQKKLGRQVTPFDKKVWGQKAVAVVTKGSLAKYRQNAEMKRVLFATYPKTLVESSPRDRLWGIGLGRSNEKAQNRATWRGKNLLGETLTKVRNKLMAEEKLIPEMQISGLTAASESGGSEKPKDLDLIPSSKSEQIPLKIKEKGLSLTDHVKSKSKERKTPSKDSPLKKSSSKVDRRVSPNINKDTSLKEAEKSKFSEHIQYSKDRVELSSSQERKTNSSVKTKGSGKEKKHATSEDKSEHTPSKKKEMTDGEPEKQSKDKDGHTPSKKRKTTDGVPEKHSKDKGEHTPSKKRKRTGDEPDKHSKDKGGHAPSKKREMTDGGPEKHSKDKDEHTPSKKREMIDGEPEKHCKDKGGHSPSKKKERPAGVPEQLSNDKDELILITDKDEATPSKKRKITCIDEEKMNSPSSKDKEENTSSSEKTKKTDDKLEKFSLVKLQVFS